MVRNKLLGGVVEEGLNRFYVYTILNLGSAVTLMMDAIFC